jgi:UDPglucose 6-dehydrogenase
MTLSVVGLGKLGLCTAVCLAQSGYRVLGVDNNPDYVETLQTSGPQFFEVGLDDLFKSVSDRFFIGADTAEAIERSSATFIIVPTPSTRDGSFSNRFILQAIGEMAPALKRKTGRHIVNVVSTVSPGACEEEIIPFLEEKTGKRVGADLGFAYNPEFIAIGSVIRDFLNPDLVLIGESDEATGETLQRIYEKVCDHAPRFGRTGIANAEIAKLAINCYCTMKISFANNLGEICSRVKDADASQICEIIGNDSRIGGKYIKPGLGFGGPCFPRDNEAFINFLESAGGVPDLQQAVIGINDRQVGRAVDRIRAAAGRYGSRVALLGLAYKPDTYLCERSQALDIAKALADEVPDLALRVYDPMAACEGKWTTARSLEDCVTGANVAAILTPWPTFQDGAWQGLLADKSCVLDFWS